MSRSAPFENRWVRAALATLLSAVTWLTPTPSRAAPEGQITWGVHISLAPTWFDPAETPGIITPFMIMYALHDAMVKPMPGTPLAPSLAESWTVSRDGLAYEFVLRKGARFHNGDPVTAEDVKFSLERYRGTSQKTLKDRVAAVETPDPWRVRIRLKQPWPDFMTFYSIATGAGWIVPKKYVEKVGEDGFKKAPIGAGPYRFVSFTPGVELVLEAFDQYWRRTPSVKRLVFRAIPDDTTRLAALKRGEVDIAYAFFGPVAEEVRRTPGLTLKATVVPTPFWVYFADQWDPKSPWHDRRVRLAANHAIDRQAINEAENLGHAKMTSSIVPASFDFYWQPPGYAYDPARARQLLVEAGYPNGFDAGDYFVDAAFVNVAEATVNYLQAAGIRTRVRPLERAEPRPGRQRRIRQRRHEDRGLRRLRGHLRVRKLSGYRRPVPRAGDRAGSEATRGDAAPHPAARARQGDLRPDLAAGRHERRGTEGRGAGHRTRGRLRVLLFALRGRATEEPVRDHARPSARRARSGRSLVSTSTPSAMSRRMSGSSFTVQTPTATPAARAASITVSSTSVYLSPTSVAP